MFGDCTDTGKKPAKYPFVTGLVDGVKYVS
jgi:hypothetical protein